MLLFCLGQKIKRVLLVSAPHPICNVVENCLQPECTLRVLEGNGVGKSEMKGRERDEKKHNKIPSARFTY